MQAGNLVSSDVQAYTSRVLVNGIQREVESWSVDRELSGDLPVQIVAVSGVTQATGSVEFASKQAITDGGLNPWNRSTGWLPKKGDRVEIYAGDSVTEWKQFHGVIDTPTGSINGGFKASLIDDYDDLSAGVEHQAMLRVMPPLAWDGSEPYRDIGLHPLYYVDYALRQAGFHTTPPREYDTLVFAPMQGSWWPHYGQLASTTGDALNTTTPWGLGRRDGGATYWPAKNPDMGTTVQMSALVAPDHAGAADFFLDYGSSADSLRLSITGDRTAIATKNGVEICRLNLGAGTVISLLAKAGTISLKTNTGANSSGAFTTSGTGLSTVRVNTNAPASIGGFQASLPAIESHEHFSTLWEPSAVLDTSSLYLSGIIDAAPAIEDQTAQSLLTEIGKATLSAMWIDETGVFKWASSDGLREAAPARSVTTLDDVLALDWEDSLLGTASKVTVSYERPAITKSRWRGTRLPYSSGGGQTLKSGDETEIFLEPEAGTYWIMPAFDFLEIGGTVGVWGSANNPAYSLVGMYFSTDGGQTEINGLPCTITTAQLGLQKALVKYAAGAWASDVEGVLKTSPTNANLWPKNQDMELPRLVGRGVLKYTEQKVIATGAGGPGPGLVHETGVWASRTDSTEMQERFAAYLQSQTSTPKPTITGLSIMPDPRLQLGDVITIDSPDLMGITMTALIVGVSSSFGSTYEQSLTVRIINTTSTYTTYAEYNDTLAGTDMTYTQWQALGPLPQTYAEFNNE